jgi:hypothetical protein
LNTIRIQSGGPFLLRRGRYGNAGSLIADNPAANGSLWFSADNKRGAVVDDLGPGLLIVGTTVKGGAMAILTTYSQDDAAFEQTSHGGPPGGASIIRMLRRRSRESCC